MKRRNLMYRCKYSYEMFNELFFFGICDQMIKRTTTSGFTANLASFWDWKMFSKFFAPNLFDNNKIDEFKIVLNWCCWKVSAAFNKFQKKTNEIYLRFDWILLISMFFFLFFFSPRFRPTEELQSIKESESRYKQQFLEGQKREKVLVRRLAAKEQEMQEYVVSVIFELAFPWFL